MVNGNDTLICGRAKINKSYAIKSGNIDFYNFIGDDFSYVLFYKLIHEEDQMTFVQAFRGYENGRQIAVRMMGILEKYHLMLITFLDKTDLGDDYLIEIEITDVGHLGKKLDETLSEIEKARAIFGISNDTYFEYEKTSDRLKIFTVENRKDTCLYDVKLSKLITKINEDEDDIYPEKELTLKAASSLKSGDIKFEYALRTRAFAPDKEAEKVYISGVTLHDNVTVGIIETGERHNRVNPFESQFDALTGIFNKSTITKKVKEIMGSMDGENIYLAVMDVDNFKNINDSYGHMFGDEVIAKVGSILSETVGNKGFVGRIGGDEFLLVFNRVHDEEELRSLLKTIRKNFEFSYAGKMENFKIGSSIGVANYPQDADNYDELFKIADHALYIAKRKGKNRYIIYRREAHGDIDENGNVVKMNNITVGDGDRQRYLMEVAELAFKGTQHSLKMALKHVADQYGIDRAIIYYGMDLDKVVEYGEYLTKYDTADYMFSAGYRALFDENGVFVNNSSFNIEQHVPNVYSMFVRQAIRSYIQIIIGDKDNVKGLISFDVCKSKVKWTPDQVYGITVAAKYIAIAADRLFS